jgi:hypothetical protein
METVRFRHAHFSARFPVDCLYTPSHFWMWPADGSAGQTVADAAAEAASGDMPRLWHVGFTKFATRMLGELVEMVLEVTPGQTVAGGERLGTVEGFVVDPLRAERVLGLATAKLSEHVGYIYRKQLEEAVAPARGPPADWEELVEAHDNRDVFQATDRRPAHDRHPQPLGKGASHRVWESHREIPQFAPPTAA